MALMAVSQPVCTLAGKDLDKRHGTWSPIRIAVAQIAPIPRDVDANCTRVIDAVRACCSACLVRMLVFQARSAAADGAHLVIVPELILTGYLIGIPSVR